MGLKFQVPWECPSPLPSPVTRPPPPPLPCIRMRPTRSSQRSPHAPSFFPFTRVVLAISIAAMVLGQVSAFSPDYVKAKVAAARLFKLFDRVSAIDSSSEDGNKPVRINSPVIISTSTHSDCCAFAPKIVCKLPKNTISRNYWNFELEAYFVRERTRRAERVIMESNVAKHYVCKRARHCGIIILQADAVKRIDVFPV